jgi:diguanylate cyclase (GGDEF)-like protein
MEERELRGLEHIRKLLKENTIPELKGDLADLPVLRDLHEDLAAIRNILYSFSAGDISPLIRARGILPGCLKALQAHLRHMIWQVQMVEQGDFSQQVQFMGEFSAAFNHMVKQLDSTIQELKKKEEALTALTENLQNEVTLRNSTLEALQASESRFKYLASHDPLTGALNRRSFMERAASELQIAAGMNIPCCLAIMDIDHFKRFNDTFGHLAGDEALRHIVRVISAALRKNDFMGRYGGEEFVLLFNGADKATGLTIAGRVRASVESSPVVIEAGNQPITASFGVALAGEITRRGENYIQELINCADIALYQAKETGRNRVVCYTPELNVPGKPKSAS